VNVKEEITTLPKIKGYIRKGLKFVNIAGFVISIRRIKKQGSKLLADKGQ